MPLSLRQSSPPENWRCRLLDGVLFVVAATALVWSLPIRTPWAGLDPGWAEALVQATDHGRIFGRDVVFTFGPYHQLYTRQISENLNLFLLGRWLYGLGWGAVMLSVRRQVGHPLTWLWLLLLAVLTSQRLDALFNVFCLAVTLTALCRSQAESLAWPNYLCQLCSLLLGILIKLSFLALAVPTIAILVAVELGQIQARPVANGLRLLAIPMIAMLLLYVVMGSFAGYQSANLYKTFRGKQWQRCTLLTAFLYPGVCFAVFFIFNCALWSYGSSGGESCLFGKKGFYIYSMFLIGRCFDFILNLAQKNKTNQQTSFSNERAAVPVLSMVAIISLWFGISVPLVFLGAYVGFRKEKLEFPIEAKPDSIPRQIPEQPWYLGTAFTVVIGGILPFGACFVELFFILNSIWMDQYYYVFGFTLIVALILCVTCAEITMVLVYFQLCSEDYNWWWRSFLTSGSTAFYVFLYSAFYFSKLEANLTITYFIYFGYMTIICFGMFLITGLVGYSAALWFTKKIYSSIKVD